MLISSAVDTDGGADLTPVTLWSEKVIGEGQDGLPVVITDNTNDNGVIAVFDGLGGAGSGKVFLDHAEAVAGARVASNLLATTFMALSDALESDKGFGECFNLAMIRDTIAQLGEEDSCYKRIMTAEQIDTLGRFVIDEVDSLIDNIFWETSNSLTTATSSRLKSNLTRMLPTTMAGAWYSVKGTDVKISSFWSGDSRGYLLGPNGLQQLTVDHAKSNTDAYEALKSDSTMAHYISEKTPNTLSFNHVTVSSGKCLLVVATDGAFDYLPTPMHFELKLLESIQESSHFAHICKILYQKLEGIAGDDISVVISPIGLNCFDDIKKALQKRTESLTEFVSRFDEITGDINNAKKVVDYLELEKKHFADSFWENEYKKFYESYLNKG